MKIYLKILREILRLIGINYEGRLRILRFFDTECNYMWQIRFHKFSYAEVFELLKSEKTYPKNILSIEETVNKIIYEKISLCRFGDGEEFVGNLLNDNPKFPRQKEMLFKICQNGSTNNCLVCINGFDANDKEVPLYFQKAFAYYYACVVPSDKMRKYIKFNTSNNYGNSYSFFFYFDPYFSELSFEEKKNKIKKIWDKRKILFVISPKSNIPKDIKCFDNTKEKAYVFGPSTDAFCEYEKIYNEIIKYDTDWLIYLEMGSCATVLSWELSKKGYQAIDMGSYYNRIYCE